MSTYTYLPNDDTKLRHLWSNLVHYSTFGHSLHTEPAHEWLVDVQPGTDVLRVYRSEK